MTGMTEQVGSPPLTRGIHRDDLQALLQAGFTPAHAGNTESVPAMFLQAQVHPRSRGEYQQKRIKKAVCSGSPPLTRGIRFPVAQSRVTSGFTPAHAGNTEGLGGWNCRHRVHPRSRGEYFSCSLFRSTSGSGVHPRSRGEYMISPSLRPGY